MYGPVAVIGGANTDILGFSEQAIVPEDSNPGHVRVSAGGVGRNVAENLARLGIETRFVTAIGEGVDADVLAASCRAAGIDLRVVPAPGIAASRYIAIMDDRGALALAVNDMRALDALTPDAVDAHASAIDDAVAIVLDTNLSEETLRHVAERWGDRPIMLDTVSVAKAPRARGILGALHTLKLNEPEAASLAGTVTGSVNAAVEALLASGVPRVIVTGGIAGALIATADDHVRFVPPPVIVVNATGAGDAYMAGIVYATLAGFDTTHTAAFSSALAGVALGSELTVSEDVAEQTVLDRMEAMLS